LELRAAQQPDGGSGQQPMLSRTYLLMSRHFLHKPHTHLLFQPKISPSTQQLRGGKVSGPTSMVQKERSMPGRVGGGMVEELAATRIHGTHLMTKRRWTPKRSRKGKTYGATQGALTLCTL